MAEELRYSKPSVSALAGDFMPGTRKSASMIADAISPDIAILSLLLVIVVFSVVLARGFRDLRPQRANVLAYYLDYLPLRLCLSELNTQRILLFFIRVDLLLPDP